MEADYFKEESKVKQKEFETLVQVEVIACFLTSVPLEIGCFSNNQIVVKTSTESTQKRVTF